MISWCKARRIRQIAQVVFFSLFVMLLLISVDERVVHPLVDMYMRLDPLIGLSSMLASRTFITKMGLGLFIVLLTLLVGRVWCGWICPLGSLLEWLSFKNVRKRTQKLPLNLRKIKYYLLMLIIVGALFKNTTLLVFDPITIITRTMTFSVIPAFVYAFNTLEKFLYQIPGLSTMVDLLDSMVRGSFIPFEQPIFSQSLFVFFIFLGILISNWLAPRFWCRYMCPLGALLGWLSRFSLFRPVIGSRCSQCERCAIVCQPGAISTNKDDGFLIMPSECTVCLDCLSSCRDGYIRFKVLPDVVLAQEFDLSRRQALGTMALGVGGILLLASETQAHHPDQFLIRPPGVKESQLFLSRCLRCTLCMKVCPTTALQPSLTEAGIQGIWTPILVPRIGYCDYGCNTCGQVCPSGAIPNLSLDLKREQLLGKASINKDRCLPWSSSTPCIVCEEMCPTPQKAIHLEETPTLSNEGELILLQRPVVVRELCIGCGICENKCPLEGEAAIRVYR